LRGEKFRRTTPLLFDAQKGGGAPGMTSRKRAALLVSGRGANMTALIAAAKRADYPAEIALVLSNRPDAAALGRARDSGITTAVVDHTVYGKDR
jgi:phosphoribosylglycinamide formyltransferase 1